MDDVRLSEDVPNHAEKDRNKSMCNSIDLFLLLEEDQRKKPKLELDEISGLELTKPELKWRRNPDQTRRSYYQKGFFGHLFGK